ncbi:hypothetical protein GCM10010251_26540 [Streptomyces aurantiogriseus]|uniref:Uncharacterized protein n=1 Tax=Streptomyces aurantiogriseus TaxID=66870 RepID=A0A918C6P9_9ACTN|nr:hypothetical protein GCM10010251_26540 [Streptomyces aurantiogriseus]
MPSPPSSAQNPSSTTNADARPSLPGRWNRRAGSTCSPNSPSSQAIESPSTNDRRRLAVSAYIGTRVTEGEPDFAPCPPRIALDPELRAVWTRQRHNVFHRLCKADHQPYYGALKPLLEGQAQQLAQAIDHTCSGSVRLF